MPDPDGIGAILTQLGHVAAWHHDVERATNLYTRSLAIFRQSRLPPGIAMALSFLGMVLLHAGEHGRGVTLLEESLGIWQQLSRTAEVTSIRQVLDACPSSIGDSSAAHPMLYQSLKAGSIGNAAGLTNLGAEDVKPELLLQADATPRVSCPFMDMLEHAEAQLRTLNPMLAMVLDNVLLAEAQGTYQL